MRLQTSANGGIGFLICRSENAMGVRGSVVIVIDGGAVRERVCLSVSGVLKEVYSCKSVGC
jgi:hypothetical protein